eukprot:1053538-Ditylum_brightwellii.AAC.1
MSQATHIHKKLTNSLKNKNPNVLRYVSLLSAEKATLKQKKKQEDIRKLHNDAIGMSGGGGHMHDAALEQEQFADYLLHTIRDLQEAKYHLEGALQRCTNWSDMRVVEHLHNKY